MNHRFSVLTLLLVLVLVLAGCGGQKDAPAANGATGDSPAGQEQVAAGAGDPAKGATLYTQSCIACHGPEGIGVQGLGKPFTTSEFLTTVSDEELIAFIKQGRDPSDPLNTTGVAMPPKGGNPALSDQQIADIVAYVRTLHE